jgi:hypothetical protein
MKTRIRHAVTAVGSGVALVATGATIQGGAAFASPTASTPSSRVISAGYSISTDQSQTRSKDAFRVPFVASKTAGPGAPQIGAYNFVDSDFILRMRGSAVQPEADIPRPLVIGVAPTEVWLEKDIGGPESRCETYGAGYYAGEVAEQGILENSGPPDAGNKGGGIFNPTRSKDYKPNKSPGSENLNTRRPEVRSVQDGSVIFEIPAKGNGVHWEGVCDNDAAGHAIAYTSDVAGAQAAGSATTTALDKKTGIYTGTSRAFIAGLQTASGTLDLISSYMQVKHLPGQAPTVSYKIGVTGGTLAAGANVPYQDLTKQFNDAVNANGEVVSSLASYGLTLMGPTASKSETGSEFARYVLNAPFLEVMAATPLREGTAGERTYARLVNIDYEGLYQGGTLK